MVFLFIYKYHRFYYLASPACANHGRFLATSAMSAKENFAIHLMNAFLVFFRKFQFWWHFHTGVCPKADRKEHSCCWNLANNTLLRS